MQTGIANIKEMLSEGEIHKITCKPTLYLVIDDLTKKVLFVNAYLVLSVLANIMNENIVTYHKKFIVSPLFHILTIQQFYCFLISHLFCSIQ